jgi:hypothetical protein
MPKAQEKDCRTCQNFTPCPCVWQRDRKGTCAADNGQTVYIEQNKNCQDWKSKN